MRDEKVGRHPRSVRLRADNHAAAAVNEESETGVRVTPGFEVRHRARDPGIDDLEILRVEASHEAAAAIPNDNRNGDEIERGAERRANLLLSADRQGCGRYPKNRGQERSM